MIRQYTVNLPLSPHDGCGGSDVGGEVTREPPTSPSTHHGGTERPGGRPYGAGLRPRSTPHDGRDGGSDVWKGAGTPRPRTERCSDTHGEASRTRTHAFHSLGVEGWRW